MRRKLTAKVPGVASFEVGKPPSYRQARRQTLEYLEFRSTLESVIFRI